jgi:hypothetical protein
MPTWDLLSCAPAIAYDVVSRSRASPVTVSCIWPPSGAGLEYFDPALAGLQTVSAVVARTAFTGDAPAFQGAPPTNDVEALARVLASEVGYHSTEERLAVGWTVRNRARRLHRTILELVCSPSCGRCCDGRPFSSYQAPTDKDLRLARDILSRPSADDPTGGARQFFEPLLQDRLASQGSRRHRRTADDVRQEWAAQGYRPIGTVGRIELWT